MAVFKPMLACDFDETVKLRFPVIVMPKIDGVRALAPTGRKLVGRSLKTFANVNAVLHFATFTINGLDGEMIVGDVPNAPNLCRKTSSALSSVRGTSHLTWWIFDDFYHDMTPYSVRLERAAAEVASIDCANIRMVPHALVSDRDELDRLLEINVAAGFEGSIIRDPEAPYKFGRSTASEGGYLRVKQFATAEIVVTHVTEGRSNHNEAKVNELGYTARSTHNEHMVPNGMVGAICGYLVDNIVDNTGRILFRKGLPITVAPGKMTAQDRKNYFTNPDAIVGKIATFQHFIHGAKDAPRFATFQHFRMSEDL